MGKKLPRKLINYQEGKRMLPPRGKSLNKAGVLAGRTRKSGSESSIG